ncbi:MAG: hypothetical protein AMXMBFR84_22870 [Candidatus Hydrogenedentota bacterium]
MVSRVHVIVRGRVQGVGFRLSAYQEAVRLGLTGWVRNRADGCVEAEIEGDSGAVENMLAWCSHGPPHADVESIEVDPMSGPPEYVDFSIR